MQRTSPKLWQHGAAQLAHLIASREVSASEVIAAHIDRIEQVNPQINAMTETFFDQAVHAAKRLDDEPSLFEGQPLRGVPISIKECFLVAGGKSTLGMTSPAIVHEEDGPQVARLRDAGGVIMGMTNVPQLMVIHETRNPVYGTTNNPWNLDRSVGGSSGGEAAILAAGGTALGLGSDLGGSIRLPSHFCGVAGLKPTSRRLLRSGAVENLHGMAWLEYQPGPMARHVADLRLAMQVLSRNEPQSTWNDAEVSPLGFDAQTSTDVSSLRIGVYADDGFFSPCPAVKRAIADGIEGLQARGATIVELEPPKTLELLKSYFAIASADGGRDFRRMLKGSKLDPEVARLVRLAALPRWTRPLIAMLVLAPFGKRKMSSLFQASGPRSADSLWQVTYQAAQQVHQVFQAWDQANVDVVLCPVHATPALKPSCAVDMIPAASYSILMNLLGVPCGSVPATRVRLGETSDRTGKLDASERLAAKIEEGSAGLPVGVQVAGRFWREDQVLDVMEVLESHYRTLPIYPDIVDLPKVGKK
ncbi:Glutamyl-tRNA(Gln) amidotransferase subunit A [Bremerella volcania]|uniref:Glutamyl-tRNA(Gln) amidotransferase subunit A n=1 Tax=Bremerella volcania TaxID=2527984 RepID=A0A518CD67_9BACT|nr:amidase family protein [Bremerella volcania]QDU77152.1 Glutamyl-tRNA(Gln) amidotransferase subunit A [Bremerella volcania]